MNVTVWVIVAVVVVVGVVVAMFGWDRYRRDGQSASDASHPTEEVFTDPATGKPTRVWYDPATGEREYRPD
jgi:hypothetical protein